jgi:hypothetical protein
LAYVAPILTENSLVRISRFKPANVLTEEQRGNRRSGVFFSFEADFAGRVKARPADRNFGRDGQRRAFTPAVILFIALPETKDNIVPG